MKAKIYSATGTETIQEKVFKGTQSLNFTGIYKVNGPRDLAPEKFKVEIKRDSYDFQSYAKVSVWNETNGWMHVASLNFKECESSAIFSQTKPDDLTVEGIDFLGTDTEELLEMAKEIVF